MPVYGGNRYQARFRQYECPTVFDGADIRKSAATPIDVGNPAHSLRNLWRDGFVDHWSHTHD